MVPELRAYSVVSSPPTSGSALMVPITTGTMVQVDLPAIGFPVATGDTIRLQALYFDTRSWYANLMASNEIWFSGVGAGRFLLEAVGSDSGSPDPLEGFFRIHWLGGPEIAEVVLDFAASQSPALQNAFFDTDAPNMGDFFGAGSSQRAGCAGTFRQGSDRITGLRYDAQTNSAVTLDNPVCNLWIGLGASWLSGFEGGPGPGPDFRTLTFRFDHFGLDEPGGNPAPSAETLRFDCDTDGGPRSGGGHAGMVVTVRLGDGTVLEGALIPDPGNPDRSFISF